MTPELESLFRRALRYFQEYQRQYGQPPESLLLTPEESRLVRLSFDDERCPTLYGMKLRHPQFVMWGVGQRFMLHPRIDEFSVPMVLVDEPLSPIVPSAFSVCETRLPTIVESRQLLCPCGEVLWDLSPLMQYRGRRLVPYDEAVTRGAEWMRSMNRLKEENHGAPKIASDEVSDEVWEQAVHKMIDEVQRRRQG